MYASKKAGNLGCFSLGQDELGLPPFNRQTKNILAMKLIDRGKSLVSQAMAANIATQRSAAHGIVGEAVSQDRQARALGASTPRLGTLGPEKNAQLC